MEYIRQLEEHFQERKNRNPIYSLRAYARDLGLHPSTLSKVLKGERGLPFSDLEAVAVRLDLSVHDREKFFSSVLKSRGVKLERQKVWPTSDLKVLKSDSHFQILAEWEHYAILSLLKTEDFRSDIKWVSERLGISVKRCETVIDNLMKAGLLEIDSEKQWTRTYPKFTSTDGVGAIALKVAHLNEMRLAMSKLWDVPIEKRDFCSMMMTINPKFLKAAKKITRSYFRQMEEFLDKGPQTEVYQLAVQFFPVTKKTKKTMRSNA